MTLSEEQVTYINNEKARIESIISHKPSEGIIVLVAQREALRYIINLHNIDVRATKALQATKA
jgi:hypothetical protein